MDALAAMAAACTEGPSKENEDPRGVVQHHAPPPDVQGRENEGQDEPDEDDIGQEDPDVQAGAGGMSSDGEMAAQAFDDLTFPAALVAGEPADLEDTPNAQTEALSDECDKESVEAIQPAIDAGQPVRAPQDELLTKYAHPDGITPVLKNGKVYLDGLGVHTTNFEVWQKQKPHCTAFLQQPFTGDAGPRGAGVRTRTCSGARISVFQARCTPPQSR